MGFAEEDEEDIADLKDANGVRRYCFWEVERKEQNSDCDEPGVEENRGVDSHVAVFPEESSHIWAFPDVDNTDNMNSYQHGHRSDEKDFAPKQTGVKDGALAGLYANGSDYVGSSEDYQWIAYLVEDEWSYFFAFLFVAAWNNMR